MAPEFPVGPVLVHNLLSPTERDERIAILGAAPAAMEQAVRGLTASQLDTVYRRWTIRQIVHHLADSHVHSYIRCKWTLTEPTPTIKAYDEGTWADLIDSRTGDVAAPLALMRGLHERWVMLLKSMTPTQFTRAFFHPQSGERITLDAALCYYAWHCQHHTGQVNWLRQHHGW